MGSQSLLEALVLKGEERARQIWAEAEEEIERLRDEAQRKQSRLEQSGRRAVARRIASSTMDARREAERRARALRTEARDRLSRRLLHLAGERLAELRDEGYDKAFARLAAELPETIWERITVHPDDLVRARRLFPGASVLTDPAISGGLKAVAREGRIMIDNTLEKRLERAWPDLLPTLLRQLRNERGQP